MLKGSGDFPPKDPIECPEDCPYIDEDGNCNYEGGFDCYYQLFEREKGEK